MTEQVQPPDFRRQLWIDLLKAAREGRPISEQDKKALELRKLCLQVADTLTDLVIDPKIENSVEEAELVAKLADELQNIKEYGVVGSMHVGDPPESFNTTLKMTEYLAGQIINALEQATLVTPTQINPQLEEFSEVYQKTPDGVMAMMNSDYISPNVTDFTVIVGVRNLTRARLYADLESSLENQT